MEAITALRSAVDTLIIIPNDKLLDGMFCFTQPAVAIGLVPCQFTRSGRGMCSAFELAVIGQMQKVWSLLVCL